MATEALIPHIHHERQEQGSMLCAQHALNALLQGNYYDPSQLADIAKRLDALERTQLDDDAWRSRDTASLNMDDTGYFSVSVLEQALEVWGLSLIRWRSEAMRPYQSKPEEQLAFVLNFQSHWFTIRGFLRGYWFNLNSFLPQPSWVGPSYLGALLDAAETEGYSVFVVKAADDSRAVFQSSLADECAATLPHASIAGHAEHGADKSTTITTQGLRPSLSSNVSSSSIDYPSIKTGHDDEEADLQAALRASMAGADLGSSNEITPETSSRMHSPSVIGQRRFRGVNSGEEDSVEDEEETDAHVDAIAPSRRRIRGMSQGPSSSISARGLGVPYVLPTASGARRRASRLQSEEEDRNSASRRASRAVRRPSGSHQHPIALDDEDEDGEEGYSAIRSNADGTSRDNMRRGNTINIDDEEDEEEVEEEEEDFEELNMATSAPRSPFLNPALRNVAATSADNSDEDFHSISSGEGTNLDESWIAADTALLQRQAAMSSNRMYDDEDAQLQAALAASMQDAEGASSSSAAATIPSTADWISEEDSRAIREAQEASWTSQITRQDSDQGPTPADVAKIAKMRADAKRKEEEERLGIVRKSSSEEEDGADFARAAKKSGRAKPNHDDDDDDDSDEEDNAPQMSPEEMRRARLARFGAA